MRSKRAAAATVLVVLTVAGLGSSPSHAHDPDSTYGVIRTAGALPDPATGGPAIEVVPDAPHGVNLADVVSWRVSLRSLEQCPTGPYSYCYVETDDVEVPVDSSAPLASFIIDEDQDTSIDFDDGAACLQPGTIVNGVVSYAECGPLITWKYIPGEIPQIDDPTCGRLIDDTTYLVQWALATYGGPATSYRVDFGLGRYLEGMTTDEPRTFSAGPVSTVYTHLKPGSDYQVHVTPINGAGEGHSTTCGFRTAAAPVTTTTGRPAGPYRLRAVMGTAGKIHVSWRLRAADAHAPRASVAIRFRGAVHVLGRNRTSVLLSPAHVSPDARVFVQTRGPGGRSSWAGVGVKSAP